MADNNTQTIVVASPIGGLLLEATQNQLTTVHFYGETAGHLDKSTSSPILRQAKQQLEEYFAGDRREFTLPLAPRGTAFEQAVWKALEAIPYGQTITYMQLAKKLGDPNKVRAVGRANGQNPLAIVIPCHRVIGAGNKLTGYAGGVENKRWLLQHEGALLL